MNKKFMDEEDNHNLTNFIIRLSLEDKPEEFLEDYFTSIENIYGKDGSKRHLYSTIFSILYFIDDGDNNKNDKNILLERVKINIEYIYVSIKKIKNKKLIPCIVKLYDHINLDIARLDAMRALNFKTEKNKADLINELESKEKKLKSLIEEYAKKINDIEIDAMKKLTMFLSVFTLIAGNISIIFKGIDIKPNQLVALIFIINPTLILAIHTLFNLVTKEKYRKNILVFCIISILIGLVILVFSDIVSLIMLFA